MRTTSSLVRKKKLLNYLLASILISLVSCEPTISEENVSRKLRQDSLLNRIEDNRITAQQLDSLIACLDSVVDEPHDFWAKIAQDSSYSKYHRGRSTMMLISRHVYPNTTLNDMIRKTGKITWISRQNITTPRLSGGSWKLMEKVMGKGRVYKFQLFPELMDTTTLNAPDQYLAFYLGLPSLDVDSLTKFLHTGDTTMEIGQTKILAVQ